MDISIAICDDVKAEAEYLSLMVKKWAKLRKLNAALSVFESAESFLFHYAENKAFDLLLLDIQMGAMNGIELARKMRKDSSMIQIVFITGFPDFMPEGYDVSALHYLMKPVKEDKLAEVMDRACGNMKQSEKQLFLTYNGEMYRIPFSEIRYIEAQGHYIIIRTISSEHKIKMKLSEVQKSLDNAFFRCQRSFIVNLAYIRRIKRAAIILDDMTEVPLSRDRYDAANRAVISFFP